MVVWWLISSGLYSLIYRGCMMHQQLESPMTTQWERVLNIAHQVSSLQCRHPHCRSSLRWCRNDIVRSPRLLLQIIFHTQKRSSSAISIFGLWLRGPQSSYHQAAAPIRLRLWDLRQCSESLRLQTTANSPLGLATRQKLMAYWHGVWPRNLGPPWWLCWLLNPITVTS